MEVPDRALVPAELQEGVGAGAQPALHPLRHFVVLQSACGKQTAGTDVVGVDRDVAATSAVVMA